MILTGRRITEAVHSGEIMISPFDPRAVNPNSYNYRLGSTLRRFAAAEIDVRQEPEMVDEDIPDEGVVLQPGTVHLGTTEETIGSDYFVPSLIGRSSLGRLGVFLQISADLGNLGAIHRWTLEIVVCQPIRLYAGMVVGQVSFWTPSGEKTPYTGYFGRHSSAVLPNRTQLG